MRQKQIWFVWPSQNPSSAINKSGDFANYPTFRASRKPIATESSSRNTSVDDTIDDVIAEGKTEFKLHSTKLCISTNTSSVDSMSVQPYESGFNLEIENGRIIETDQVLT